jgi:hypothetical protein
LVIRGNPLKKYNSHDFKLNGEDLKIENEGINILKCHDNYIQFEVIDDSFFIQITGFDTNRDLFIKI